MFLFLLLSIPLFYLIVNALYSVDRIRFRDFIMPFFYGVLTFVPAAFVYWIFSKYIVLHNSFSSFYFYQFLNYIGFFLLSGTVLITLFFIFLSRSKKRNRTRELTGWFSGYFFCFNLGIFLLRKSSYGVFEYFLLPLGVMTAIMLVSVFIGRFLYSSRSEKLLCGAILALLPFLLNLAFLPGMYRYTIITFLILLLSFSGAALLFLLEIHGRLGRSR